MYAETYNKFGKIVIKFADWRGILTLFQPDLEWLGSLKPWTYCIKGVDLGDGFLHLNKRAMSAAVGPDQGALIAVEAIQFWIAVSLKLSLLGH